MSKTQYESYNKFDVVFADFGCNPNGVEGGKRPAVIVSCDASNHGGAPQVSLVPLSTKLKNIPVHVLIRPEDARGDCIKKYSHFMPENIQTIPKRHIQDKRGFIPESSRIREQIDRALIAQFDLLPMARKIVFEEINQGIMKKEGKAYEKGDKKG
ncbi:MAG: type II toxin-antitoxin system PemK/MazF family toxin [Eubacteriales bacterium]|nr:type II toxin-antitoxin system PemK/MazF family toxin [Eubacteriales bacterium]